MATASAETPTRIGRVRVAECAGENGHEPPAAVRLGPLLALSGLTGGAGTTTLAYLIALAAARQSSGSVLVADTGGPSGGLAACAGVEVPRSLGELAEQVAATDSVGSGIYATGQDGLRVLAAGPEFSSPRAGEQVGRLLSHAREAHRLTVIDCGTLSRKAEQTAARAATHIAWILPATADGVSRGRRVLHAAPLMAGTELVIARADTRHATVSLRELRRIAADRHAPLVLVPHLPGLDAGRLDTAMEAAQVPVQAILGVVRR